MNDYPKESWKLSPRDLAPHFMNLFFRISAATAGLPTHGDKVYRYVEVFFWKFVDHFNSCFHLAQRTPILGRKASFYDASSINVLIRSAWEAYLTFSYIYIQSDSVEDREFRFWGWWLSGLLDRQRAPRLDLSSVLKMGKEKADITEAKLNLQGNPYFEKMTPKQQNALLRKGKWRSLSWADIAVGAGFSRFLSDQMYSFLSHYAHSGSASLMQLADEPPIDEIERLSSSMLRIPLAVGAHFAYDYCELIDDARVKLNEDDKIFLLPWIKLGSLDPGNNAKDDRNE